MANKESSTEKRSRIMRAIKSKDTSPEIKVRQLLRKNSIGYRKNYKQLRGKPDIVSTKHRAVVLVHGCFWHAHGCHLSGSLSRLSEKWPAKIERNAQRDRQHLLSYVLDGWRVLVIWECAVQGKTSLPEHQLEAELVSWVNSRIEGESEIAGETP